MDLTICQSCSKVFNQSQRVPKMLICGCIQCTKCLKTFQKVTDTYKCKIHNLQVNIEEQNLKEFQIQEYFMQEIDKFEQQANLLQLIKDLSDQTKVYKSKLIRIKKTCIDFQRIFSEIVKQVTQILCQKEVSGFQKIVDQIEEVLKKINVINERYQQIKKHKVLTSQECNININELNNLNKEFEEMQTEIKRARALNFQDKNKKFKIIQEVSFQVFQEQMSMSQEQRANVYDYIDVINRYINQQNIAVQNEEQVQRQQSQQQTKQKIQQQIQSVQVINQPLQELKIESVQHLQDILNEFQNQKFDVSSILNNQQSITNLYQNYMILYDLVQQKSEKNQQFLLQILNLAKNQPKMQVAAAYAITILNYMNFAFTQQNFQNIDLSNSDLSDTTFNSCNFSNSNLTSANLRNTKFINCNLNNTNLSSISSKTPHIFTGHTSYVYSVAISSDSNQIVSGSYDKSLRLYNSSTGDCKSVMRGHKDYITSVAISSDGKIIVSGSADKTLRKWDGITGECKSVMKQHTSQVNAVAISSDGKVIVSGSADKTLRKWDGITGECQSVMSGHISSVYTVAISSDGKIIVSGSADKTVRRWDGITEECQSVMSGHTSYITSVAISNDSKVIISGCYDKTIRIWNALSSQCFKVLSEYTSYVYSVIFSSDDKYIISSFHDKTIRIWNVSSDLLSCTLLGHTDSVGSLAISKDNTCLVSSNQSIFQAQSSDCNFRRWNISRLLNIKQDTVLNQQQAQQPDWNKMYAEYGLRFQGCSMINTQMSAEDRERYIK